MARGVLFGWVAAAYLVACGSAPPPPATAPPKEEEQVEPEPTPPDAAPEPEQVTLPTEAAPPPSTASYEQATSTPEPVDVHDDHAHLTDGQLTAPMRGALDRCRVPPNIKVTIQTAVQNGRAIGVTVHVELPSSKTTSKKKKRVSQAAAKAEAKRKAKIVTCADHAVRALTWPPSRRRDAFTTTF